MLYYLWSGLNRSKYLIYLQHYNLSFGTSNVKFEDRYGWPTGISKAAESFKASLESAGVLPQVMCRELTDSLLEHHSKEPNSHLGSPLPTPGAVILEFGFDEDRMFGNSWLIPWVMVRVYDSRGGNLFYQRLDADTVRTQSEDGQAAVVIEQVYKRLEKKFVQMMAKVVATYPRLDEKSLKR